jgi:DNA-binding response OmpR family regulator
MKKKQVLVIEDDNAIRSGIVDALEFEGYMPLEAKDGKAGLEAALTADCDCILLDLVLPFRDGMEILEEVRKARPTLPVIILTARGEENDRVKGLNLGADDYVVKPFSVKELLARVEAVLRRSPERPSDIASVELPEGTADFNRCEIVFKDTARTELSERERDLLRYLAQNSNRAVSREEILAHVWRIDPDRIETRTVDMHIARLREKVRDNGSEPAIILTVRGKGYMFKSIKDD